MGGMNAAERLRVQVGINLSGKPETLRRAISAQVGERHRKPLAALRACFPHLAG